MKQKLASVAGDEWESTKKFLDEFAKSSGNSVNVLHNKGFVVAICFQSAAQKTLFAKFGDVFQMDGTYKTNKLGWSLYTILVSDGNCVGQAVYHFLIKEETTDMIKECLTLFAKISLF